MLRSSSLTQKISLFVLPILYPYADLIVAVSLGVKGVLIREDKIAEIENPVVNDRILEQLNEKK